MPTPSRRSAMGRGSVATGSHAIVAHAQLREHLGRAAVPRGDERVADVAQVLHADATGKEPRRGEVAKTIKEGDPRGIDGLGARRPRDVVEQGGALRHAGGDERGAEAVVARAIEPGLPAALRGPWLRAIDSHEVHEL